MDLEEFVVRTLLSIAEGVTKAQERSRLYIAPGFVENEQVLQPQMVSFEVSVTAAKEAGGGIKVLSFGDAKAIGKSENRNSISFQVPVYFQAPTPISEKHFSHHERSESKGGGGSDIEDRIRHVVAQSPPE